MNCKASEQSSSPVVQSAQSVQLKSARVLKNGVPTNKANVAVVTNFVIGFPFVFTLSNAVAFVVGFGHSGAALVV